MEWDSNPHLATQRVRSFQLITLNLRPLRAKMRSTSWTIHPKIWDNFSSQNGFAILRSKTYKVLLLNQWRCNYISTDWDFIPIDGEGLEPSTLGVSGDNPKSATFAGKWRKRMFSMLYPLSYPSMFIEFKFCRKQNLKQEFYRIWILPVAKFKFRVSILG